MNTVFLGLWELISASEGRCVQEGGLCGRRAAHFTEDGGKAPGGQCSERWSLRDGSVSRCGCGEGHQSVQTLRHATQGLLNEQVVLQGKRSATG